MKCAQCDFKTSSWSALRSHAGTVHRFKPEKVNAILNAWDDVRDTSDREAYDMGGYSEGPSDHKVALIKEIQ